MSDTCFLCKGNLTDVYASYMSEEDGRYIIIKNVPGHKCRQCGEVSYSLGTVRKIEEIIEKIDGFATEIAIVNYNDYIEKNESKLKRTLKKAASSVAVL